MLSNKLTFSLVFVLVLVFAATSVYAQVVPEDSEPAKGKFAVVARTAGGADATTPFGASNGIGVLDPVVPATDGLGDLDDILLQGGTIELALNTGTGDTFTVRSDESAAADDTSDEDIAKLKHMIVISEIMWGLDRSGDDDTAMMAAQWIEIYNHNLELKAGDTLNLIYSLVGQDSTDVGKKVSRTVNDTAGMYVILDQVSTSGRFGPWTAKGNSGNTETIKADDTDPNAIPPTSLVSMYRNIALNGAAYKTIADGADKGKLEGLGDGNEAASWTASAGSVNMRGYFVGSPSSVHVTDRGTVLSFAKTPASISATGVTINEVRNDTSEANLDWVEFFNNTDPSAATSLPTNIENWTLSITTRIPKTGKKESDPPTDGNFDYADVDLFSLPKFKFQPGDYLVVYNRDPGDTILAGGVNIEDVAAGRQVNKGASHMYVVRDGLNLPSDKKFALILRSTHDKETTHEAIVDFAGNGFFKRVEVHKFNTDFWPLIAWPATTAQGGDNTFASANQSWGRQTNLNANGVFWPDSRADDRGHGDDWQTFEAMGGVGYDRDVDLNSAPGTPGYANVSINVVANDQDNAAKTKPYAFSGMITISEVMYDAGPRWNLIQWIELYNSSMTETINLKDWTMEIRNKEDVESYVDSSFEFGGDDEDDVYILPNQTLLLVSGTGANDVDNTRVYNLYQHHRRGLGLLARDSVLLSRTGFYLKLTAKVSEGGETKVSMVMDEAGNVMIEGAKRTVVWELPARDPDARQSLVRQFGTRAIDGTADAADDGTMEASWTQSDVAGAGLAYYGHRNDVGTPGFRLGGPLPVSLATFRPLRDKATGEVVITWVTESELNNAGFNILRADSKDGEFEVINLQGIIAGHGTTSEKHVYTYTDKNAKPNVAYYYQIEDVSLNGNRTTLRTTHMRGNVNASGKLTTTWSNLKFQK